MATSGELARLLPTSVPSTAAHEERTAAGINAWVRRTLGALLLVALGTAVVLNFRSTEGLRQTVLLSTYRDAGDHHSSENTKSDQVSSPEIIADPLPSATDAAQRHGHKSRGGARTKGQHEETRGRDAHEKEGPAQSTTASPASPNVIFVLLDDVGVNDLGYSSTDMQSMTPFIDSLASQGVRLTSYYTAHMCTPARSSLLTGRYPFRNGMQYGLLDTAMPWGLPIDEVTLAERFKAMGYATHMVGKWNLGMATEGHYPFNRGFDTFLGYMGPEEEYDSHQRTETFDFEPDSYTYNDFGFGDRDGYIDHKANTTRWGLELRGNYSTAIVTARAIDVARAHKSTSSTSGTKQPLFMYLAFQAAHKPLEPPDDSVFTGTQMADFLRIGEEGPIRFKFAKVMRYVDISLQRIFAELDQLDMMEDTLVVLTSDNGACPSGGGSNFPHRGVKHTLFEGGVRTPALVYSASESIVPLHARGTTYDDLMHVTDWIATLASVTGIPTVEMGPPMDGLDHWSAIVGNAESTGLPVRDEVVLGCNSYVYDSDLGRTAVMSSGPRGAFLHDGWKLIVGEKCTGWFSFNPEDKIMTDPACAMRYCPTCDEGCTYSNVGNKTFLFHLETDPFEQVNLLNALPGKYREMEERWRTACAGEVPSHYLPNDQRALQKWRAYNDWAVAWL